MLRFLPLKLGRLYRCLKLLLVVGLFVILLMNTHNLFASFQKNELTDRRFINLNKCPACFGTSWCRKFMNGQVSFETWGRLRFLDVFNVKNVYFAQYGEPREGTRRVVLKRLGSNQELADIDQKICKRATGRPRCDLIQAMYKTEFARINGDVRLLTPEVVEGWSDLVHCPSQRLLDRVVRRYAETKDSGSFLLKNLKDTERMQLLMTLAFNPEPLVLQSFPSDEGWPFAKYLGACGRVVAVNYVGEELWSFYNAPWEKRVDLARQLMDIAEQLTNNDFEFALYLLDVSFDNFAVGPRDGKVIIVDAENVLVADKRLIKQNKPENYDVWYESRFEECDREACLSFSKDSLCSRVTVDHNYYAVCQNLLSRYATWRGTTGGLLHDPPAHIAKDGQLEALLDECTKPKKRFGRFQAAKELREYLTQLAASSSSLVSARLPRSRFLYMMSSILPCSLQPASVRKSRFRERRNPISKQLC
uniref:Divergent protein kinase domain 2Ab n=2 Tax=Takifugu rubripes TaxID=31033 RepID=H2V8S5_TAKRU